MDKITEQDLANRGVKGLPDVPGLTTEEMQRKLEEIAREILIPKVNELVEGLNNANSNLKITENDVTTGYEHSNTGTYKKGNIQYINSRIQFPVDVASAYTFFTIAYAPENLFLQHAFCGVINYGNIIAPALFRITTGKEIQIFLSQEIIILGSVSVTAYLNTDYRIAVE